MNNTGIQNLYWQHNDNEVGVLSQQPSNLPIQPHSLHLENNADLDSLTVAATTWNTVFLINLPSLRLEPTGYHVLGDFLGDFLCLSSC